MENILSLLSIVFYRVEKYFPPVIGVKYYPHFDLFLKCKFFKLIILENFQLAKKMGELPYISLSHMYV